MSLTMPVEIAESRWPPLRGAGTALDSTSSLIAICKRSYQWVPLTYVTVLVAAMATARTVSAGRTRRQSQGGCSPRIASIASVHRSCPSVAEPQHPIEPDKTGAAMREVPDRHALFAQAIENARFGFVLLGRGGEVLGANGPACEVLGQSEADLCNRAFAELVHPDDRGWSTTETALLLDGAIDRASQELR